MSNRHTARALTRTRYRRASATDVPMMVRCRESDPEVGPADTRMAAYLAGEHHPREAIMARGGYVAHVAETPVGYTAGHLTRRYGCQGEIQYLYVAPMHRRLGVARQLVLLLARWFLEQHATHICVDVNEL